MATTVGDFVKMLYERECGVVVMLCECEEGGVEVCAQYWPESTDATMKLGELLVSTVKVTETDGITQRLITLTDSKVNTLRNNEFLYTYSNCIAGNFHLEKIFAFFASCLAMAEIFVQ